MTEDNGGFLLAQDQCSHYCQTQPADAQHTVAHPPAKRFQEPGQHIAADYTTDAGACHDDAQNGRGIFAGIGLLNDDIGSQIHTGGAEQTHGSAQKIEHPELGGQRKTQKAQSAPDTAEEDHTPDTVLVHVGTQERSADGTGSNHQRIIQGKATAAKAHIRAHRHHEKAQRRGDQTHGHHQKKSGQGGTKLRFCHI